MNITFTMWMFFVVCTVLVTSLPVVKDVESLRDDHFITKDDADVDKYIFRFYLGAQDLADENRNLKTETLSLNARRRRDTIYLQETRNSETENASVKDTPLIEVGLTADEEGVGDSLALETIYKNKGGVCTLLHAYSRNPLYIISRCQEAYPRSNIKDMCESRQLTRQHEKQSSDIDLVKTPVQDENGLLYRNIYCAQCNHVLHPVVWQTHMECNTTVSLSLSDGTEKLVVLDQLVSDTNICVKKLEPAFRRNLHECSQSDIQPEYGHRSHDTRTGTSGKSSTASPFPLSFSMLMNFGFDGKTHILLSTAQEEIVTLACNSANEIYDSVYHKCRAVSCNVGYKLTDGVCRKLSHYESDDVSDMMHIDESVQVTLTLKNVTYEELFVMLISDNLEQLFIALFREKFGIGKDRIVNMSISVANNTDSQSTDGGFIKINLLPKPTLPSKLQHNVPSPLHSGSTSAAHDGEKSESDQDAPHLYRDANVTNVNVNISDLSFNVSEANETNASLNGVNSTGGESIENVHKEEIGFLDAKYTLTIKFVLLPPNNNQTIEEKTVKSLVKDMSDLVYSNSFLFTFNGTEYQVHSIENENTITSMDTFCLKGSKEFLNGDQFVYYVGVMDTRSGVNATTIVINETGQTFGPGDYDLTISVEGTVGNLSKASITSFAFVCVRPQLQNQECIRITLPPDEYTKLESSSIEFNGHVYGRKEFEYININDDNDFSIRMCAPNWTTVTVANQSRWRSVCGDDLMNLVLAESYLTFCLGLVSLVAMSLVLVTYSIFEKLRNLPGINTMNLTLSLFLGELAFIVSGTAKPKEPWLCSAVGILLHYLFLASFFWMNVMCFDVYKTFANRCILTRIRNKKKYLPRYALYAWGSPLLIVSLCAFCDFSGVVDWLKVGYGGGGVGTGSNPSQSTQDYETANHSSIDVNQQSHVYSIGCWIQEPVASMVAFGGPMMVILFINAFMFIRTIICIRASTKLVKTSVRRYSISHMTGHHDVMLYIRMSTVMGFTWIFGLASSFVSAFVSLPSQTTCIVLHLFGILFIVFNCGQGIFIFFAFVFNKRVFALYKKLYARIRNKKKEGEGTFSISGSRDTLFVRTSQLSVSNVPA